MIFYTKTKKNIIYKEENKVFINENLFLFAQIFLFLFNIC